MEFVAEQEACERRGESAPEAPPSMASSGYGQGREQPPIRTGAVLENQVSDTGITGYLFNQPIVGSPDGSEKHLDDYLGKGFSLVGFNIEQLELTPESEAIMDALGIRQVDLIELKPVRGKFARFGDSEVALVRPDKIVFGHSTQTMNVNQLLSALAKAVYLA